MAFPLGTLRATGGRLGRRGDVGLSKRKTSGLTTEGLPAKSVAESLRTGPVSQCVPTPPFVLVAPDGRLARRRRGGVIDRSVDADELAGPPAITQQGTLRGTEGRQWRGTERHRDPDRDEPDGRKATKAVTR
jgi:hypothetical protein